MKYKICCFLLVFSGFSVLKAQTYGWKLGVDYFFDNTEYEKSSFLDSQTMNGLWLNAIGKVRWDSAHSINGGVNLLKIPGMKNALDKVDVTLYYQYKTPKVLFRAGAFPRREALCGYSDFFFKDSINNFEPLMQGVFWQMGHGNNFFNLWMDWTGYSTPTTREKFLVGFSGKLTKGLLFADFQSYMLHNANSRPHNEQDFGVRENMQLQASLGVQYSNKKSFTTLFSAGTLLSYERDRLRDELHKPAGFVARANAEYWGIGTQNTLYLGNPRMRFADRFGGDLYWGTQFLQGKSYLQSKWYVRFLESDWTKVRFNCNLHFSEGNIMFQQTLSVVASFDTFSSTGGAKKTTYPWLRIFNHE